MRENGCVLHIAMPDAWWCREGAVTVTDKDGATYAGTAIGAAFRMDSDEFWRDRELVSGLVATVEDLIAAWEADYPLWKAPALDRARAMLAEVRSPA